MATERPGTYTERKAVAPIAGTAGTKSAIGAGAAAGIIGGIGMGLVAMLVAMASTGTWFAFWDPMRLIAATFYGDAALIGGADVVFVGALTHMVVSAFWGVIFGLFVGRRNSAGGALLYGLVYGVAIWAVMTWIALPIFNETMLAHTPESAPGWWFFYHLVYGGLLFCTPLLARMFAEPHESRRAA